MESAVRVLAVCKISVLTHRPACDSLCSASRIHSMLHRLRFAPSSLSSSAKQSFNTLVCLAQLLGLKGPDQNHYAVALIDARDEFHAARDEVDRAREENDHLARQLAAERRLHAELVALEAHVVSATEAANKDAESKRKQVPYFQMKVKEYSKESVELERRLHEAGFHEHLAHGSILDLSDEVADLNARIEPLDQQLLTYQQLPPVSAGTPQPNAVVASELASNVDSCMET
jgi:hypothetical protein